MIYTRLWVYYYYYYYIKPNLLWVIKTLPLSSNNPPPLVWRLCVLVSLPSQFWVLVLLIGSRLEPPHPVLRGTVVLEVVLLIAQWYFCSSFTIPGLLVLPTVWDLQQHSQLSLSALRKTLAALKTCPYWEAIGLFVCFSLKKKPFVWTPKSLPDFCCKHPVWEQRALPN